MFWQHVACIVLSTKTGLAKYPFIRDIAHVFDGPIADPNDKVTWNLKRHINR